MTFKSVLHRGPSRLVSRRVVPCPMHPYGKQSMFLVIRYGTHSLVETTHHMYIKTSIIHRLLLYVWWQDIYSQKTHSNNKTYIASLSNKGNSSRSSNSNSDRLNRRLNLTIYTHMIYQKHRCWHLPHPVRDTHKKISRSTKSPKEKKNRWATVSRRRSEECDDDDFFKSSTSNTLPTHHPATINQKPTGESIAVPPPPPPPSPIIPPFSQPAAFIIEKIQNKHHKAGRVPIDSNI